VIRIKYGQEARKKGDLAGAREHFRSALAFHPDAPAILQEMVLACADDPEQRALYGERLLRACCDKDGRVKLDPNVRKALPKEEVALWEKLCQTRASAVAELGRFADKVKDGKGCLGNGMVARWCAELGHELMAEAPQLYRTYGQGLQKDVDRSSPERELVIVALQRLMARAPKTTAAKSAAEATTPEWLRQQEQSIRAARILAGLGQQASFKDTQGPAAPELASVRGAAAEARERLQTEAAERAGKVWSIDELKALDAAQRSAFTLAHREWSNPGIARSPTGLYRIETICGFETLLGAAETIELHHRRLCDHFGADPFQGRPGDVHIVPEHAGLESEGVPFWWAAGFQSGDRTTVRFAWGNVPALGRLLTHELTHRFDGAVFPFQPAWLTEGHAVWTAASYAKMADEHCIDGFLDVGSCLGAGNYGQAERLRHLIEGTIEDYRDNYAAGCALYMFLRTWPVEGEPKYRARLDEFRKNGRAGVGKAFEYFTHLFCDGKNGRPAGFPEFAAEFQGFLEGIARWSDHKRDAQNKWVARYVRERGPSDNGEMLGDEPTHTWEREHAEPFFGQEHAAAAGALLAEVGENEAAAAAFLWALAVDGWQARTALPLPALLQGLGRTDAAAAATVLTRARFPAAVAPTPVPFAATLTRTQALLTQLAAAGTAFASQGQPAAAARLRAERDRVAAWLGQPPLSGEAGPGTPGDTTVHPFTAFGLTEDSLTGYDKQRHAGLWFVTPELDLHVGREQPRNATGLQDRTAQVRSAFVRSVEWQAPGAYSIRARIHFTTSYAAAAIVFGHVRRDRDLRLHLASGDYNYAVGRSEDDHGSGKVSLKLEGLWERDQHMPFANPEALCDPGGESGIGIEIQVRGPSVLVLVEGEAVIRYAVHDGTPIEGSIGFATSVGAIRVQEPRVQRLDRTAALPPATAVSAIGLDPLTPATSVLDDLLLRPVHGIPTAACGTLVLWIPQVEDTDGMLTRLHRLLPILASMRSDRVQYPASWQLCVPEAMDEEAVKKVQGVLQEPGGEPLPVLRHRWRAVFTGDPWLLFVDEPGLLRAAAQLDDVQLHSRVARWARLFRRR
jgi:hypothetical protein